MGKYTNYILAIALIGLTGCSLTTAQQADLQTQVQKVAVQAGSTAALQTSCVATQTTSTWAVWATQNPGKQPTSTQLASWGEMAAAKCILTYPPTLAIQAAPAS